MIVLYIVVGIIVSIIVFNLVCCFILISANLIEKMVDKIDCLEDK